MQQDWLKIYSSDKPYQVEIAQAVLAEEGIQAFKVDKKDSAYSIIGEVELYVLAGEEIQAKLILIEHELL